MGEPTIKTRNLIEILKSPKVAHKLILYNDDVNDFHYVMNCLCGVLGHERIQAEQLTLIAHSKGQVCIKEGIYFDLETFANILHGYGLSTSIE